MKIRSGLIAALMGLTLSSSGFAEEKPHEMMCEMMQDHHDVMMQMHQKMETVWKEQDAELDKLIAQMNSASGDQKVTAMEAVVSKLVELRKKEHEDMLAMGQKMQSRMQEKMKGKGETSPSPDTHSEP